LTICRTRILFHIVTQGSFFGHHAGQEAERTRKREFTLEEPGGGLVLGQCHSQGGALKKVISPDRRRQAVEQVQTVMDVSERSVCRVLGQPRSTQRYKKRIAEDEEVLAERMIELAREYGRYGYRRITTMLRQEGWRMVRKSQKPASSNASSLPTYLGIGIFILVLTLVTYLVRIVIPLGKSVFDFPTLAYFPQVVSFFGAGVIAYRRG